MNEWYHRILEGQRQRREDEERKKREAALDERETRREGRETRLLLAAIASALIAVLAAAAAFWQGYESHEARKDAQRDFETTRKDATASAAQARQDALDTIQQQLAAQHELRDQTARSAKAAEASAATAARALTASQRPWLKMEVTSAGTLDIDDRGITMHIPVLLRNIGKSIATGIRTHAQLIPAPTGSAAFRETTTARDRLCSEAKSEVAEGPDSNGQSIFFDSEGTTTTWGVTIRKKDAARAFEHDGSVIPMVIVCTAYHATYDSEVHSTARVLLVLQTDPSTGAGVGFSPTRQVSFQPSEYSLVPAFSAGLFAD